jgi:hypothetical protein
MIIDMISGLNTGQNPCHISTGTKIFLILIYVVGTFDDHATIRIRIILGRTKIDRDTLDAPKNPKPRYRYRRNEWLCKGEA